MTVNANFSCFNNNGYTAFHLACQSNNPELYNCFAAYLNKNNVNIATIKEHYTPLHLACHNEDLSLVTFLLSHNANVNAITSEGNTPLHLVCAKYNFNLIRKLISCKPNLEIINNNYQTICHLLCQQNADKSMQMILKYYSAKQIKTILNIKDICDRTVFDICHENGNHFLTNILTNYTKKDKKISSKKTNRNNNPVAMVKKSNVEQELALPPAKKGD